MRSCIFYISTHPPPEPISQPTVAIDNVQLNSASRPLHWQQLLMMSFALLFRSSLSLSYQSSSCYISVNQNILRPTHSINNIANIHIWDIIWYLMVHLLVALLSYHQIHSNEDTHLTRALLGEGCWRKDISVAILQRCPSSKAPPAFTKRRT